MVCLLNPQIDPRDDEFRRIRDDQRFEEQRITVERLWERYEPYADDHFKEEISRQFHRRFWEMYLACVLMDHDHKLLPGKDKNKKKNGKGPDICIEDGNCRIWIEAIAPGRGEGPDAVPLPKLGLADYVPDEKIILRLRSAIEDKSKKYAGYIEDGILAQNESCVIAVNGWLVPSSSADFRAPFIFQAVLPIGPPYISFDRESLEVVDQGHSHRPVIQKKAGAPVSTAIFLEEEHKGISGLLYSGASVLNLPSKHGSELVFLHNPMASNPLPKGWLKIGHEFWIEDEALRNKDWTHEGN